MQIALLLSLPYQSARGDEMVFDRCCRSWPADIWAAYSLSISADGTDQSLAFVEFEGKEQKA